METLTEPGVLSHNQYPIGMGSFYGKQDPAAYYFASSHPTPTQGYPHLPAYPQPSEQGLHNVMYHHQQPRYNNGGEESSRSYYLSAQAKSSGYSQSSQYTIPAAASSVQSYPAYVAPSGKERSLKRIPACSVNEAFCKTDFSLEMNNLKDQHSSICKTATLQETIPLSPVYKHDRSLRLNYQSYPAKSQNMPASCSGEKMFPSASQSKHTQYQDKFELGTTIASMPTSPQLRIEGHVTYSLAQNRSCHQEDKTNYESKQDDMNTKNNACQSAMESFQSVKTGKDSPPINSAGGGSGKNNEQVSEHVLMENYRPAERYSDADHLPHRHDVISPQAQHQTYQFVDSLRSDGKFQSPSQNGASGKSVTFTSIQENGEISDPSSFLSPQFRRVQNEDVCAEAKEELILKDHSQQQPLASKEAVSREFQSPESSPKVYSLYPSLSSSPKESATMIPSKMSSLEEHIKKSTNFNAGIGHGEDGSLIAKKEVFSDDDDGDQPCSPITPSSPDVPATYPPHFPHSYFASPGRPTHQLPFAAPQRVLNQQGPGFSFARDLTAHFPLSGISAEIAPGTPYIGGPVQVAPRNEVKDIFFCHLCNYSGKSKTEFDAHMNIHFEYTCPHCDYTSRTEGRLRRHIKDFHSEDSSRRSMPGRPKIYRCKTCSFQVTEKDEFWAHARIHIKDDKMLQCPKCPFVTEYKHHLEYHLRNHFGSKPFKCNKCNYSCVNKSMLNSHMKSHTNVYQYRCSNCTYATKYCHSLKLHLKKYNHKPATVLNHDGSLPQGLDAESSGLAISAKRGPPRGPRGPRKDKNDPYLSQLFGMPQIPLGINPMLNGMIPFWPLLPHGHLSPPQPLPSIGNLTGHMMREEGGGDNPGIESGNREINDNSSDSSYGHMKEEDVACKLCKYVGESTDALCMHFVAMHKQESKEVAKAYGINEASLVESIMTGRNEITMRKNTMPDSSLTREKSPYNVFHGSYSSAGLLSKEHSESLHTNQNTRSASYKNSNNPIGYLEMSYSQMGHNYTNENNSGLLHDGMDILQQMTLKFGNGTLHEKSKSVARDETKKQSHDTNEESKLRTVQPLGCQQKETPLDLTKPKSVSPPAAAFSNLNLPDQEESFCCIRNAKDQKPEEKSKRTEQVFKKRSCSEEGEAASQCGSGTNETSTLIPRKRSRKGKAYKLDALCLKLQERQTSSPGTDDGLCSDAEGGSYSDLEVNFECFQPLQAAYEEEEEIQERLDDDDDDDDDDLNKDASIDCVKEPESAPKTSKEDIQVANGLKSGGGVNDDVYYDDNKKEEDDKDRLQSEASINQNEETSDDLKDRHTFTDDEAEYELAQLQKTLNSLDKGHNPQLNLTEKESDDTGAGEEKAKDYEDEKTNDARETKSVADEVDPVQMIHTVLENRKKSLPAPVRRGTELAWKLLNDPVNPVTSLPLPVDSSPPLFPLIQSVPQASGSSSSSLSVSAVVSRNSQVRPAMRQPAYHSSNLHSFMPPTPMAYIPPSNRLIHPTVSPTSIVTQAPSKDASSKETEMYRCTYCHITFENCVMYTVHMGYHSNCNPFQCNSCGNVSSDKVEFFLHMARAAHK